MRRAAVGIVEPCVDVYVVARKKTGGYGETRTWIIEQLRKALQIKNLTAIKTLAEEIIEQPTTKAIGVEILECAIAFNFARLNELLDQMENPSA